MSHLLASFDAILSDLDGVVYAGPDPIPGAVPALNRAQREGVAVAYVTNNASRSVETVAEPFLVREGLLGRTPRGRIAMAAAWEHLGLEVPNHAAFKDPALRTALASNAEQEQDASS